MSETQSEETLNTKVTKKTYEVLPSPNYIKSLCVYDNNLNNVSFGTLRSNEQNLIFFIFTKMRDRGLEPVVFTPEDILKSCEKRMSLKELGDYVSSLRDHFFKLDFTKVQKTPTGEILETTINFFKSFTITKNEQGELISLIVEVNESFEYLINKLSANFTAFEMANLLKLDSKYSKTLYRLLKQYRTKGQANFSWEEFKKLMGIPDTQTFTTTRIKTKILNPAINEIVTQKDCIFNDTYEVKKEACFSDLTFTLFKKNNFKKTSPVSSIQFNWTPEKIEKTKIGSKYFSIDPENIYTVEEINEFVTAAQKEGKEATDKVFKLLEKSFKAMNDNFSMFNNNKQ